MRKLVDIITLLRYNVYITLRRYRKERKINTITVVIVPVHEKPYSEEISNDLATFQKLVGGYIEVIALSDRLMIICNENGKLEGLEDNRRFKNDIIVGNFFIAADGGDGDFTSLTDDEINMLYKKFETPHFISPAEVEDSFSITFGEW